MNNRWFAAIVAAILLVLAPGARAGKVDDLAKPLLEDRSYKVRLAAALALGKIGDPAAVGPLQKALSDSNKTVRGVVAQALGRLGSPEAVQGLTDAQKREQDPFVRREISKALAHLSGGPKTVPGSDKRGTIFLTIGPFSVGTRNVDSEALEILREALKRELAKLPAVTFSEHGNGKPPTLGFLIDGRITRLDTGIVSGATETNCDVKVTVARWPSKSILLWTSAGAAVSGGSRAQDERNARRDCLDASAVQLAEDLTKFLQSQGG